MSDLDPQGHFHAPIAAEIWDSKYRFKDPFTGDVHDKTIEDTWKRVAHALAAPETEWLPGKKCKSFDTPRDYWAAQFYRAMEDFKFIPAGRILAGAGTERNVTLFNCYVMGTIPDSMSGIMDHLKEAALTQQQGGGIGYDFSTIRPKGAPVHGVGSDASGPLSFMDVWDAMCRTVMSAGSRRGAMMATIRCNHPDIEAFIEAKQDPARLRMFNVSVLVTDAFMAAVKADQPWPLTFNGVEYKVVRAKELWEKIMRSTYAYAEPGVIFIDRINRDNNLSYMETISATNPCGEQPLPPYGACLLGSINLAAFVEDAYHESAFVNMWSLEKTITTAVRMMDNVNDVSRFPLEVQKQEAKAKRRIGLGVTGLADALLMCGLRYGSDEAAERAAAWSKEIALAAYQASIDLAKEKGVFPALNEADYCNGDNFASRVLTGEMKRQIRKTGIRNSHLLSIAPTGTISLYAGNVSSGVEPIFAPSYTRKVLQPDGSKTEQRVVDYAVAKWEDTLTPEEAARPNQKSLPPAYVDAQTLTPSEHIKMQAAIQPWIDTSISKTVNVPKDITFEDFTQVYLEAFESGCKGCTTYRPNDVTGSVISVEEKPKEEQEIRDKSNSLTNADFSEVEKRVMAQIAEGPMVRPEGLEGRTYKIKIGDEQAVYVTINNTPPPHSRPFEIFITTKNPEHKQWTDALALMISAVFRRPHDSTFVIAELKSVFDPKGGGFWKGAYCNSVVAAIGQTIETHMREMGYTGGTKTGRFSSSQPNFKGVPGFPEGGLAGERIQTCEKCHSSNLKAESGCLTCMDCGHSKCG